MLGKDHLPTYQPFPAPKGLNFGGVILELREGDERLTV